MYLHMKNFFGLLFVLILSCVFQSCQEKEEQAKPYLEVLVTEYEANVGGDEFVIDIRSNTKVNVVSDANWLRYMFSYNSSSETGSLKITVNPNNTIDDRSAVLKISAADCPSVNVTVTQRTAACVLSSFALPASLNALDKDVVFEAASGNVYSARYLKWIDKDNPELLVPVFESKGDVYMGETRLVSGETPITLADDLKLTVKNSSGNSAEYTIVFNCPQINRELPVLHMKPDRLIDSKDNYVDTYIELYDKTHGSTGEGWWDSAEKGKIEMRGRGNSTWPLPKKPFRMKFPEKFSPIGLNHAKEKSWTLLAQDMDKSLLRTHLAFEYSRELFDAAEKYHDEHAVLFTPASRYVNVYLTGDYHDSASGKTRKMEGEYLGLFQMSDQVERASGRIAVEKLEAADGDDPDKITGGYIIESDIHEGNHYSSKGVKFTYKYPKDDDFHQSQYDYISRFINSAEDVLYGSNFKNPENGWRKYFDEKTLADYIIIKELAQDMDGFISTYAYKRRGCDKLFFGPVWDCDKGWDNERRIPYGDYQPLSSLMMFSGFRMPGASSKDWYMRVWEDETFRSFVAARWDAKRDELMAITERVLTEVPAQMQKSIEANFTVWPFNYQHCADAKSPASTYELEIQRIRDLTQKRAALLDKLFHQ
jgi:hypothetical protein